MSDYDKARKIDTGHPSGLSPSDAGNSMEELEGSEKAFRRSPTEGPIRGGQSTERDMQTPGGDSRPDDLPGAGFVAAEQHSVMDGDRGPAIQHESAERLESTRVDQEDEIVGQYDPVTGAQKAVLRPRTTKKGAESEGL